MEFTPITGLQIRKDFYTSSGCVLEDVIENYFYQHFKTVNPYIIGMTRGVEINSLCSESEVLKQVFQLQPHLTWQPRQL